MECHQARSPDWDLRNLCVGSKRFATVYGSDSHKLDEIGRRTSWVRMQEPTLNGLRVALLDGSGSITEYLPDQPDPGPHSSYAIERITISGTKYIGRNDPQVIELNPSFNAIIGGRGSGKSSVLELIRLATKRGTTFGTADADCARTYRELIDEITAGLPDVEVAVDYRQYDKTFRMVWKGNDEIFELSTLDDDGTAQPVTEEGVWSERFPIRIFSQKQLYTFKEQTGPLLDEIDRTPEVNGSNWQKEWEQSVSKFISLLASIQQLRGELAGKDDLRAKLADLERQIGILEKAGHKKVLRELSLRRRQHGEVQRWEEHFDDLANQAKALADDFEIPPLSLTRMPDEHDTDENAEKALEALAAEMKTTLDSDASALRELAEKLEARVSAWKTSLETSVWQTARADGETAYENLVASLRDSSEAKPEQYGELVQSRQLLRKKLDGLAEKEVRHGKLNDEQATQYEQLRADRKTISDRRSEFLESLFSKDANLRAELVACGDIDAGISSLRTVLGREGDVSDDEFNSFREFLEGAESEIERLERIHQLKDKFVRVAKNGPEAVENLTSVRIRKPFANHMASRTMEDLARLLAWFPPDLLKLRYRAGSSGSFKKLEKSSPGQVAAAVLAFLLAYGDEPMLLDQPEDDLDNRLIYDLIVKEIRANKLKRQLVVITHNPNIVVNGAADLIIPIKEEMGRAVIESSGSLQVTSVRTAVCDIMEGGREALERRFRRIVG